MREESPIVRDDAQSPETSKPGQCRKQSNRNQQRPVERPQYPKPEQEKEMLTSFEAVEEASEIGERLWSKGADRASEQVRPPAGSALRPCLLRVPGSDLYEDVPGRMTRSKGARMWIRKTQRPASRFEGGEGHGGEENRIQESGRNGWLFGGDYSVKPTKIHEITPISTAKKEDQLRKWVRLRKEEERNR